MDQSSVSKHLFLPDLHARFRPQDWESVDPHYLACQRYVDLVKISFKEPMVTWHVGDVHDRSKENGDVNGLVIDLFTYLSSLGPVIVLNGNHDFNKRENSALRSLYSLRDVILVEEPRIIHSGGLTVLCLPYLYPFTMLSNGKIYKNMDELYSNPEKLAEVLPTVLTEKIDVLLGHVGDEHSGDFGQDCDLSWFKGKKLLGHIHVSSHENYLQAARQTNKSETSLKARFTYLENGAWKNLPYAPPSRYWSVKYPQPPKTSNEEVIALNVITDCPDVNLAMKEYLTKYSDCFFDEFIPREFKSTEVGEDKIDFQKEGKTTREYANELILKKKIIQPVTDIINKTLGR